MESQISEKNAKLSIQKIHWGQANGFPIALYKLTHTSGLSIEVCEFGATLVSCQVPDSAGNTQDVTLGYDNLEGYINDNTFIGNSIGRFGNRIAGAQFTLEGQTYHTPENDGNNTLHGGPLGFHKMPWSSQEISREDAVGVVFRHTSPDSTEGFPGNLEVEIIYWLTDNCELMIYYKAITDKATPVNLTNHAYWNLKGAGAPSVLDHELQVHASYILPISGDLIPTGEKLPVAETPFDFRQPEVLGRRIEGSHPQLGFGQGYDHNWVLDGWSGDLQEAAVLKDPESGRTMTVSTTEPGLQVYSGNFLGGFSGRGGLPYARRSACCLETQHFPDSPNQPGFPSTILQPGKVFTSTTVHRFTW